MNKKGRNLINIFLIRKKLLGKNNFCKFFPCHEGLEDCTFCYCPFYPCQEVDTGGRFTISKISGKKVWSCADCIFHHKQDTAYKILEGLIELNKEFSLISKKELKNLRKNIIKNQISKNK